MSERCRIICADVLDGLRSLPDESVHCVITSPPYYGLRDYLTAEWEGGDADCDHSPEKRGGRFATPVSGKQASNAGSGTASRVDCFCGARRIDQQIGLEKTPQEYIERMVTVFREVRRVLRKDGTLWLNMGDSYATGGRGGGADGSKQQTNVGALLGPKHIAPPGLKPKDLMMMPARLAIALQDDGWYLRSDIIWAKPNPMPESVTDRPTISHEHVFLLAKSQRYFYDAYAIREDMQSGPSDRKKMAESKERIGGLHKELQDPLCKASAFTNIGRKRSVGGADLRRGHANSLIPYGDRDREDIGGQSRQGNALEDVAPRGSRNRRSVWTIATEPFPAAHFATFPTALVKPCVLAGTSEYGVCANCGAPWERIVIPGRRADGGAEYRPGDPGGATTRRCPRGGQKEHDARTPGYVAGWRPTCKCGTDDRVPSTVLDCFAGSCTTGLVAMQYGRNFIGIELSAEYVKLGEKRIAPVLAQEILPL